ncbi:MAG: CsbD family protein [Prochlorococcaceae cyanobacterium]
MTILKDTSLKPAAKEVEGKRQAAVGDITGNKWQKLKGEAKQVQASAMKISEHAEEGIKSLVDKNHDRADHADRPQS